MLRTLALIAALSATPAYAERDVKIPESRDALIVTCGIAAFVLVATGAAVGPYVGAAVPLLPALCDVWDTAGRPPIRGER